MNFRLVLNVVGRVMLIESAAMLLPVCVALIYQEPLFPFLGSAAVMLLLGCGLTLIPSNKQFYSREGFFAVGLIWLLTCFTGALPFWLSGEFDSFVDCFFESCSGFTTTGASILTDIEALSQGILFWRSFTHWLGGMGVLVLTSAIIPSMGIRSKYLTQAESPGPVFSKLVPKQSQTSKILYGIYCALTLLEAFILKLAGMSFFDAFIHAFGTAGTGGFSNRNASVGAYDSPAIEMIIAIFILLFSINFATHFLLLCGKFREVLKSDELLFFLAVVGCSTIAIMLNIRPQYPDLLQAFRYAFFQVSSIISTTGFASTDWSYWPQFSQMILVLLMFCGACAGSTGGGIKCSRILILMRCAHREIHQITHPRSVQVVRLDGKPLEESTLHSVMIFIGSYITIILGAALIISLDDFSFAVSFTSALTAVSNVGPGVEIVGPAGNFSILSDLSKIVMSLCMIVGRLEILPILVLLSRGAWCRI